jgi:hypothetical protein
MSFYLAFNIGLGRPGMDVKARVSPETVALRIFNGQR